MRDKSLVFGRLRLGDGEFALGLGQRRLQRFKLFRSGGRFGAPIENHKMRRLARSMGDGCKFFGLSQPTAGAK
jgi:hypothetical protein